MAEMVPKEALDYLKRKNLKPVFSYRDVWNEEHAAAFTVAKAMQLDVLGDIKAAVEKAVADGQTFESFKKALAPTLQSKGWWGRKEMVDPTTGETVSAQLGSDRRLKTIYQVNTRQAYLKGAWDRGMASSAHPYILYCLGPSAHHREQHQAWAGLVLPKDDPFWSTHAPMNGWGCKCFLRFLSQSTFERYQTEGYPTGPGQSEPIKTEAPPVKLQTYIDKRTGRVTRVPEGITPGFEWNPGNLSRSARMTSDFYQKVKDLPTKDRALQSYFNSPIIREDYQRFVRQALAGDKGTGQVSIVAYLPDPMLTAVEAQGAKPESGLVAIEERLLRKKDKKHGDSGLTEAEWLALPDLLRDWDVAAWSDRDRNLVLLRQDGNRFLMMAIGMGNSMERGRTILKVDTLRSVYWIQGLIDDYLPGRATVLKRK